MSQFDCRARSVTFTYRLGTFAPQHASNSPSMCSNSLGIPQHEYKFHRTELLLTQVEQIRLVPVAARARTDENLVIRQRRSIEIVDHRLIVVHVVFHRIGRVAPAVRAVPVRLGQ